jgi:hypothetical protein
MKIKCTINTGNYCNVTIESSEHDTAKYAKNEIIEIGRSINHPAVKDFIKVYFGSDFDEY